LGHRAYRFSVVLVLLAEGVGCLRKIRDGATSLK
jgi:hypothetical protein